MRALISVAALLVISACAGIASVSQTSHPLTGARLSAEGIGRLRVGMRVEQARALLGEYLVAGTSDAECVEWSALHTTSEGGISLLSYHGVIERIALAGDFGIRTRDGIGVGTPSAAVEAAYPNAVSEGAEYFEPPAREIYVWRDAEELTGLHFTIDEQDQVSEIQVGSALRDIDGCTPSP